MTIIEVEWKPPEGGAFRFVHWTLVSKLDAVIEALKPEIIYKDKSGSYWIPVEEKG